MNVGVHTAQAKADSLPGAFGSSFLLECLNKLLAWRVNPFDSPFLSVRAFAHLAPLPFKCFNKAAKQGAIACSQSP